MTFGEMFVLALIQSLTEFLPVSSSGHLVLAHAFGMPNQTLLTDVVLHAGTMVSMLLFFYKDIYALCARVWRAGPERRLFCQLCVATIPVVLAGFFLEEIVETTLRSPFVVAGASIFYGALLWLVDKKCPQKKQISQLSYRGALAIGAAQALSLVPGTSRSGITMTCGRLLGLSRTESVRFSMLLAIPSIGLATVYVFCLAYRADALGGAGSANLGMGFACSVIMGWAAIGFLMQWVKRASFAFFAVYRILLGLFLLAYFGGMF